MKNRLLRWTMLCAILLISSPRVAVADDENPPTPAPTTAETPAPSPSPAVTAGTLSGTAVSKRAAWQEKLTLGPGDILNFSLFDTEGPKEVWPSVAIGPDGRVSYLEARDVMAAGMTIDQLRTNVDAALSKANVAFARHAIITPVTISSKKYLVLGAVVGKGVFTMTRPITLIEAIANSGGLETGVFERNTVELADLTHSFLVRQGKRVPVDFEKLFQDGDLSQNVPMEPNDYLYIASSGANEVYVLGEVVLPGTAPFTVNTSVIGAITTRGGFTPRSFKGRVLIVRGSLDHPETFIVDTGDILAAKSANFRLQPRDIVFVAQKPWQRVTELLDESTRAFITAMLVTYTGQHVGPSFGPIID